MHVQTAGQDEGAGRVDLPPAAHPAADLADPALTDAHVTLGRAACDGHGSAADDQVAFGNVTTRHRPYLISLGNSRIMVGMTYRASRARTLGNESSETPAKHGMRRRVRGRCHA